MDMKKTGENFKPVIKVNLSALRIGSKIAEGGMAEIFSAINVSGQVVLRQLKKSCWFSRKMRKRFLAGVQLRRLCGSHPNIVQYLGEGGTSFSRPYEIIEFVPGNNLKSMIFNKHKAVAEHPLDILMQCAAAIAHVHKTGYMHLDIKPENFFCQMDGDRLMVKLSDFDLCQPIAATQAPSGFGGSAMYVPPEFFERQEVSATSDIFAFGVLAYYLYTNQMPFVGSVQSLLKEDGKCEIRYPAGVEKRLPDEVRQVIEKCLKPFSKTRYKDGGELLRALDRVRRGVSAVGVGMPELDAFIRI